MKHTQFTLLAIFIMIASTLKADPPTPPKGYRWVLQGDYSDEFNQATLDKSKWNDVFGGWQGRAPARFEPKAISMNDGKLCIQSGVLDKPKGKYTIYGGAVTSKKSDAFYGYYECKAKASKIAMSTTFWMSNGKVPFEGKGSPCENDKYSQELDIQEAVGGATTNPKFLDCMNSNTHYRYIKCGEKKETFISKGARAQLASPVYADYHIYGAWWKNAEEVSYYADNQFASSVQVSKEISDKPFDRPMKVNMVTETYDWQPAPSNEDLVNPDINTAYYDWVRAYKLVPVSKEYENDYSVDNLYQQTLLYTGNEEQIVGKKALTVDFAYKLNTKGKVKVRVFENKKAVYNKDVFLKKGFGTLDYQLALKELEIKEKNNYKIELTLYAEGSKKHLDILAFDITKQVTR